MEPTSNFSTINSIQSGIDLPDEVLVNIFSHLDVGNLIQAGSS